MVLAKMVPTRTINVLPCRAPLRWRSLCLSRGGDFLGVLMRSELKETIVSNAEPYVWAADFGEVRGLAIEPLYRLKVPNAPKR
jgi:hypothetical protein